jgi:large subunit ribosomal protein L13
MKTVVANTSDIQRQWYVVDAAELPLGRLASEVAGLLIGKKKPAYSPNQDHGDNVIVLNADKVRLTGRKAETKAYFRHSQYPGGAKLRPYKEQMAADSTEVVRHAVRGMVPKTTLGRAIFKKLHVYSGPEHPHSAQRPQELSLVNR